MPGAGDCFWIETSYGEDGTAVGHLLVIILDPEEYTKNTIVIPIDTFRSNKQDQTTILNPGDHEFIKAKSFLNYNRARILSIATIEGLIKEGRAKIKPAMKPDILAKIVDGLRKSEHTPQEVLTLYGYYMMRRIRKT